MAIMKSFSVKLQGQKSAEAFGARLAPLLEPSDIVRLEGPLGAGKTTLARGVIKAVSGAEETPSPTYTLVETYETERLSLWHFDLYRLENAKDVWELGLEEALDYGVSLIEWPERIEALLPDNALRLQLGIESADTRTLFINAPDEWAARLLQAGIS